MIQVVNRALDIIELIANEPERPKSLGELANSLNLNRGTCANILKTLVHRDYVEQIGTKKGYILGSKAYLITDTSYQKDLLSVAREEMDKLTRDINENCLLAVLKNNQRVALYRTFAEQDLQVRTSDSKPAYDSASGRLLLAMLSKEKIHRFVIKYGLPPGNIWPEIQSETQLFDGLALINREKLAVQMMPNRPVMGLAVPIYRGGTVVAGLSVYLPQYRYMTMDKQRLVQSLRQCASKIDEKLNNIVALRDEV